MSMIKDLRYGQYRLPREPKGLPFKVQEFTSINRAAHHGKCSFKLNLVSVNPEGDDFPGLKKSDVFYWLQCIAHSVSGNSSALKLPGIERMPVAIPFIVKCLNRCSSFRINPPLASRPYVSQL